MCLVCLSYLLVSQPASQSVYMPACLYVWIYVSYSSTDNFLPPIPVSDCLIFLQEFDISPEKRKENDKNTDFMIKRLNAKKYMKT